MFQTDRIIIAIHGQTFMIRDFLCSTQDFLERKCFSAPILEGRKTLQHDYLGEQEMSYFVFIH